MSTYLRRSRLAVCVLAASSLILVGCNTSEQDSNSKVSNATSAAAGGSGSASASGEESEGSSSTASDFSSEKETDTAKEKESKSAEDTAAKSAKASDSEKESTSAEESDSTKASAANGDAAKDNKDADKKDSDKSDKKAADKKSESNSADKSDSAMDKDHADKDKSAKDADAASSDKDKSDDSMKAKGDSHGSKDQKSADGTAAKDSRKDAAAAISLDDVYVKATGDKSDQTAIFGTLVNNTGKPVIITGFKANVDAAKYEIHHVVDGKMQQKKDSITIPAGGTYTLKPGGDHFILVGVKKPIKAGDKISITVNVKGGKTIELKDVKVDTTAPDGKKSGK